MRRRAFLTLAPSAGAFLAIPRRSMAQSDGDTATPSAGGAGPHSGYASINGLEMYYEVHGEGGMPLVLLHGALGAIPMWGSILEELGATRMVIAVELQGHGRTADVDRPFGYESFADDVAAVLDHLAIEQADVAGYSIGGNTALQVAIRHPGRVRRLVLISANYRYDGEYPEVLEGIEALTPELLAGSPIEELYRNLAPNPDAFPALVEKVKAFLTTDFAFAEDDLQAIDAPAFLAYGDADTVRLAHAVEMFELLGGGVPGDLYGIPDDQLVILPGTTHESILTNHPSRLVSMIASFLDDASMEPG